MKLAERIVFLIFAIFLAWYCLERISGLHISGRTPLAFIAVFLWGAHIIIQYVDKSEMVVAVGWNVPAGELDVPARQFGAVAGVFICLLAVYGCFAGWTS